MRAWQFAKKLERRVKAFLATPPPKKDPDFCRQIRKSSRSAPSNMAEGFGRFWPAEFAHKLRIAIGELQETADHLGDALDEKYVSVQDHDEMVALANRAIGSAVRFAEYLDRNGEAWKKGYRSRKREEGKRQRAQRERSSQHVEEQNTTSSGGSTRSPTKRRATKRARTPPRPKDVEEPENP